MKAIAVALLTVTVALAGCFGGGGGDKLSDDEMEERSAAAINAFRTAIGPGGELARIEVTGTMAVEYDLNGVPAKVNLAPEFQVDLGPQEDLLLVGELGPLDFTSYCSPEHLIAITVGGEQYDVPDAAGTGDGRPVAAGLRLPGLRGDGGPPAQAAGGRAGAPSGRLHGGQRRAGSRQRRRVGRGTVRVRLVRSP